MKSIAKKVVLATVVAMSVGLAASSVQAGCSKIYRTYYLDNACRYYHVDANGNKVVGGMYSSDEFTGLTLHKDCCSKRWYTIDAFGNKKFVSKRCA